MRDLTVWVMLKILGKEGETMMAMFFAQRVILGKTAFKDVPAKLKDQRVCRSWRKSKRLAVLPLAIKSGQDGPFFTYREIARRLPARIRL